MQSALEITIHPIDLAEHGLGPHRQPLFRIVWADSRKDTYVHNGRRAVLPRYDGDANGKWVMERWLPPEKLLGMTHEQYDAMLSIPGAAGMAYPEKGDYELCGIFPGEVDVTKAHMLAARLKFESENLTASDRAAIHAGNAAVEAAEVEARKTAILENAVGREEVHAS